MGALETFQTVINEVYVHSSASSEYRQAKVSSSNSGDRGLYGISLTIFDID